MDDERAGALVLVTRLARAVHRRIDQQVLGMSLKEFTALSAVGDTDGRPQQELANALLLDANGLSVLLNALEDRGLLFRAPDRRDRRRHMVQLTSAGQEAVREAEGKLDAAEDEVLEQLTATEREHLRALAAKALRDHGQ